MEFSPLCVIILLTVLIHCGHTAEKPTVMVRPQGTVCIGDTVTLTCQLQTSTGWRFNWYKNKPDHYYTNEAPDYTEVSEDTISVKVMNKGTIGYYCAAQREKDITDYSESVKITVKERPKAKVRVQPAERVFSGDTVTLICDINSGDNWSYEWFKNNKPLSDVQKKKEYVISNADQSHEGVYTCKGTQSTEPRYSETSDAVTLTVSEKPQNNSDGNLNVGVSVGLSVILLLLVTLILYCCHKKKKKDTETRANDATYSQIQETRANDVTYSQIQVSGKQEPDAGAELTDVTYAEIVMKKKKKKQDGNSLHKTTAEADLVYSEVKHSTDTAP